MTASDGSEGPESLHRARLILQIAVSEILESNSIARKRQDFCSIGERCGLIATHGACDVEGDARPAQLRNAKKPNHHSPAAVAAVTAGPHKNATRTARGCGSMCGCGGRLRRPRRLVIGKARLLIAGTFRVPLEFGLVFSVMAPVPSRDTRTVIQSF